VTAQPIQPSGPVYGAVTPPGSKSITNRALVVAALADGASTVHRALHAHDTMVMRAALRDLGAVIDDEGASWWIQGQLQAAATAPPRQIDVGASGTSARFLTAVAALLPGLTTIDGTERMRQRPIQDLVDGLSLMGAVATSIGPGGCPPVTIEGAARLRGGRVSIDASRSSQFVSALMLIAPFADEVVTLDFVDGVAISRPYLQTTAEVMAAFGATAQIGERSVIVEPGSYHRSAFAVEPDASAAVYAWASAAVTGGAVRVEGIDRSSTQADIAVLDIFEQMGCVVYDGPAGVTVRGPEQLAPVEVDMNHCPDAALAVAVVALFAGGPSTIRNVASLRIKETDRLEALATELEKLGAEATTTSDSISITPGVPQGATVATYDDHRMAMAFTVAGLAIPDVRIADPECVSKTWPAFFEQMERLVAGSHVVIAIDGPGGSGKTTVSRAVAERLGVSHLDTGAFYRAATVAVLEAGVSPEDADAVVDEVLGHEFTYRAGRMFLDDRDVSNDIRSTDVDQAVSAVSAVGAVRTHMVERQRRWVDQEGSVGVVEGRDIGTVVFPEAAVKIYLTASERVRAERRAGEQGAELETVADGLRRRDTLDSSRTASPLQIAGDATIVDTSTMAIDEVVGRIVEMAGGAQRFSG